MPSSAPEHGKGHQTPPAHSSNNYSLFFQTLAPSHSVTAGALRGTLGHCSAGSYCSCSPPTQKVKNVQLQLSARRCLDTSASFPHFPSSCEYLEIVIKPLFKPLSCKLIAA